MNFLQRFIKKEYYVFPLIIGSLKILSSFIVLFSLFQCSMNTCNFDNLYLYLGNHRVLYGKSNESNRKIPVDLD